MGAFKKLVLSLEGNALWLAQLLPSHCGARASSHWLKEQTIKFPGNT